MSRSSADKLQLGQIQACIGSNTGQGAVRFNTHQFPGIKPQGIPHSATRLHIKHWHTQEYKPLSYCPALDYLWCSFLLLLSLLEHIPRLSGQLKTVTYILCPDEATQLTYVPYSFL